MSKRLRSEQETTESSSPDGRATSRSQLQKLRCQTSSTCLTQWSSSLKALIIKFTSTTLVQRRIDWASKPSGLTRLMRPRRTSVSGRTAHWWISERRLLICIRWNHVMCMWCRTREVSRCLWHTSSWRADLISGSKSLKRIYDLVLTMRSRWSCRHTLSLTSLLMWLSARVYVRATKRLLWPVLNYCTICLWTCNFWNNYLRWNPSRVMENSS